MIVRENLRVHAGLYALTHPDAVVDATLEVTALVIGQVSGALWLSGRALVFVALGLFGVWILLTLFSVALFEREAILTRWR